MSDTFTEIVIRQVAAAGDHAPNVALVTAGVMGDAIIEVVAEGGENAAIEAAALGRCIKKLRERYNLSPTRPAPERFADVSEFSSPKP